MTGTNIKEVSLPSTEDMSFRIEPVIKVAAQSETTVLPHPNAVSDKFFSFRTFFKFFLYVLSMQEAHKQSNKTDDLTNQIHSLGKFFFDSN